REIPLPETIFLIGRDHQCHLRPHCQGVSKLHCAIAAWAGKVRVRDLKSRNGTLLNGQPINGEVVVGDGDELQVGTLVFTFRIKTDDSVRVAAPIKDERDLEWLLNSPTDSAVLLPDLQTMVLKLPAEPAENGAGTPGTAAKAPGSKDLSAGQPLRTYFETRK